MCNYSQRELGEKKGEEPGRVVPVSLAERSASEKRGLFVSGLGGYCAGDERCDAAEGSGRGEVGKSGGSTKGGSRITDS